MALPSPEEEGRAKLKGYKMLGFIGSGTFAEVSKYVRLVVGCLSQRISQRPVCTRHCDCRLTQAAHPAPNPPPPRAPRCCSKCLRPAAWWR
jgi:hypothetical protein